MLSDIGLTMGARTLWEEKMFLDFTIEVEDEQFKVHKLVMASVSDYFKAMLTGGLAESQTDRARLEALSSLAVSNIIEFVYTRDFGSPRASTPELLMCAEYLQIPAAVKACIGLLSSEMDEHNCFDILTIFQSYSLEDGVEQTMLYIKSNIEEIIRVCFPNEMTYDAVLSVLKFWPKSELELFQSLIEWVHIDYESRDHHLNKLLCHVRFALMTPEQLAAIKDMEIYTASDGGWCELVDKAEQYHKLPTHLKVLDVSDQSRVRNNPLPISIYVDEGSMGEFYLLHNGKSWLEHESTLAPEFEAGVDTKSVINNFLIVCEGRFRSNTSPYQAWYIFDPRTLKWSRMAQMVEPRSAVALVHWNKYLYALGGATGPNDYMLTDAMERYDFETNSWTMLPHTLPAVISCAGAAVIGDAIYVAGTVNSLLRMDCFNLSTNSWHTKASLREADYLANRMQKMELWGEEVLFIMDATLVLHWYSPVTDLWSVLDCPSYLCTDLLRHSDVAILPTSNSLYILVLPEASDDEEERVCAKWTFNTKERTITEVRLDDFPIAHGIDGDYIHELLSIPPQLVVEQKMLSDQ